MVPWWGWVLAVLFLAFAYLVYWGWVLAVQFLAFAYLVHSSFWQIRATKCPPHKWTENEEHQLICDECHKAPDNLRFKHYDGIL